MAYNTKTGIPKDTPTLISAPVAIVGDCRVQNLGVVPIILTVSAAATPLTLADFDAGPFVLNPGEALENLVKPFPGRTGVRDYLHALCHDSDGQVSVSHG